MMRVYLLCLVVFFSVFAGCGTEQVPKEDGSYKKQLTEPELSVYMHETGKVEKMKLEQYLEGVVGGEMNNGWELNALAAQAIIARTFTLQAYEKGQLTSQGTNASTDIREFQAYNQNAVNDKIKKAVAMTKGKIAVYQGIPIMGWFHASAGGMTALAKEGLDYQYQEPPFIQSVKSPDELAPVDIQNWSAEYTLDEVEDALEEMEIDVDRIDSMTMSKKGKSGRTETIMINQNIEVSGPKLRLALGSMKLKSMLLTSIELNNHKVTFRGKGYGHGVGMSQWGAQKMAMDGKSPEEIVKHYFNDVEIEKRW